MLRAKATCRTEWERDPVIAIADPESDSRSLLNLMLGDVGAQVHEVADGAELQALLAERSIDLVVTRSQLPRKSGLQVLAQQRAKASPIPFIVVHSFHQPLLRVFVSDTNSQSVLATRTVNADNLAALVIRLVRPTCGSAAESTRRRR